MLNWRATSMPGHSSLAEDASVLDRLISEQSSSGLVAPVAIPAPGPDVLSTASFHWGEPDQFVWDHFTLIHSPTLDPAVLPEADVPQFVSFSTSPTTGTSTATALPGGTGLVWDGISFPQSGSGVYYYPPDNALAANASVVVTAENDAIQFTDTTGGGAQTQFLSTFFASVMKANSFLTDPTVLYDTVSHRFIVAVDDVGNDLKSSSVLLAVSTPDLGSPTAGASATNWHFEAFSTTYTRFGGLLTAFQDQPRVSVGANGDIYVTGNEFYASTGSYAGNLITVLSNGLFNATNGSTKIAQTFVSASSYQPVAGAGNTEYFVSDTHNALSLFEFKPTTTGGSFTKALSISLGTIDYGSGGYTIDQPGTSVKLDAMDGRITSAAYDSAHQKLYVVFEGQPNQSSTTPSVEWAQLDMSGFNSSGGSTKPTVLHTGNLNSIMTGSLAGLATFNGSVAVDGNGDVIFNFNVGNSSQKVADYYAVWSAAGSGTGGPITPVLYHASDSSVTNYIDPNHDAVSRWGDYSTATLDPSSANGFWISNEFIAPDLTLASGSYSSWGTAVAHILV